MILTPALAKSAQFRGATARPRTAALAAMRLSLLACISGRPKASQQLRPFEARVRFPTQAVETPAPRGTSAPARFASLPLPLEDENPESQFGSNDSLRGVRLMCAAPLDDRGIGLGFGGLTQNVGLDRILHSASAIQSRWARRSPSVGRRAASRSRPGSEEPHVGRAIVPFDRDAPRRIPAPVPSGPCGAILPEERSGLWRRWWSSHW